jgi:hypothetical protein
MLMGGGVECLIPVGGRSAEVWRQKAGSNSFLMCLGGVDS